MSTYCLCNKIFVSEKTEKATRSARFLHPFTSNTHNWQYWKHWNCFITIMDQWIVLFVLNVFLLLEKSVDKIMVVQSGKQELPPSRVLPVHADTGVPFVICLRVAQRHERPSMRWFGSKCGRKWQHLCSRTGFPRSTAASLLKSSHGWVL